jgi:hypothetical protein
VKARRKRNREEELKNISMNDSWTPRDAFKRVRRQVTEVIHWKKQMKIGFMVYRDYL